MERNRVISLIRKLCARTVDRGCTESEALEAANRVGRLLAVYNLTIDQVYLDSQQCVEKRIQTTLNRSGIDGCVVAIAQFCDCKVWREKDQNRDSFYVFFGLETDTGMAAYLYGVINQAIQCETALFKRGDIYTSVFSRRKSLTTSFQKGMADRISYRIRTMKQQHSSQPKSSPEISSTEMPTSSHGTAIVLAKQHKVENEFARLGISVRKAPVSRYFRHGQAWAAGNEAGDKVNLNRPISTSVAGHLT